MKMKWLALCLCLLAGSPACSKDDSGFKRAEKPLRPDEPEAEPDNDKEEYVEALREDDPSVTTPFEAYPFVSEPTNRLYYRIPAMVVSKAGTILVFAERRPGRSDTGDIDIVLKRSTDNGKTWGPVIVVRDDGNNRCQNPAPVVLPSGRILLLSCWNLGADSRNREVYITHSDDDGLTWSQPVHVEGVKVAEWSWYATGPCHGIVKTRKPYVGRIVIPCNHRSDNHKNSFSHVIYSDDDGATWKLGGNAPYTYGNESTVAELGDGSLMLNIRNSDSTDPHRMASVSTDGGRTFGPVYQTGLVEQITGCQGSLLRYTLDPATRKATLLFANPPVAESRRNGTIKLSEDNGKTWTQQLQYVPDNAYTSYSDIAVLSRNRIAVIYESGYKSDDGLRFKIVDLADFK